MNSVNISMLSKFSYRSRATIAVETSILILIGLIAIGGNLLVIISIYRNPSLRTITNYFVLSLAMTDILYPMSALPFTVVWSIRNSVVVDHEMCDFQAIFGIGVSRNSIYTITLMAINRYFRVCKPLLYRHVFSRRKSYYMISVSWVMSLSITILMVKGNILTFAKYNPFNLWCGISTIDKSSLSMALQNVFIVANTSIPFVIIAFCYFKVFRIIKQHKRKTAPSRNGFGRRVLEIKITWTLFGVLIGYLVTWFPLVVILLLSKRNPDTLPRRAYLMATYSAASNSAINPIIYGVMNRAFRLQYQRMLNC